MQKLPQKLQGKTQNMENNFCFACAQVGLGWGLLLFSLALGWARARSLGGILGVRDVRPLDLRSAA